MGLLDWLTSDWTVISETIPVYESTELPGRESARLTFYDAQVLENEETGEKKLSHVQKRGTQFIPTNPKNIPKIVEGKTFFGSVTQNVYDADYIRRQYGVTDE